MCILMVGLKFHCNGFLYLGLCAQHSCQRPVVHFGPILVSSFITNIWRNELTDSRFGCYLYRKELFCTVRVVVSLLEGAYSIIPSLLIFRKSEISHAKKKKTID